VVILETVVQMETVVLFFNSSIWYGYIRDRGSNRDVFLLE